MTDLRNQIISVLTIPFLYAGTAERGVMPAKRHALSPYSETRFEWEAYTRGLPYLPADHVGLDEHLATLHAVAAALISNAVDVEPSIVAAVNEEFWNLL